ncbi:MAG TPA: SusC/RagA family TonB-linked outer membrane protein, partial [Chitinophagaceae bacterium]|nr:SusC/RagA family TonB-linked outer membrane protein [Chitinophagaceae bacterium]
GNTKRVNLTSAQTSVSAKEIEKTINTTVEQAIQGRAAGVYVTQNSGQPGGGISVNIRGINSITGNTEPLYVIDGVQLQGGGTTNSSNPLASLNPSDIDDIQILQGPSATAIYGSRATNGVVLITTKRGKAGQATFNYNMQYNVQAPPESLPVMNLREYAQMRNEFHALAGGNSPDEFLDPSILGEGTDWQDELFNSADMQKHQLSVSGGSNNTTYYMSGEYLKQAGVATGSGFRRYGVRVNLENKPKDWVTIGANLSFNQTKEKLTTSSEGVIADALQITPQIPVKNLNGDWGGGDDINGANQFTPVNPLAIASLRTNESRRRQFWGGLNVAFKLAKGLTLRTTFNTDINYSNSLFFNPTYRIGWAQNTSASLSNNVSMSTYWNWNQLLEYTRQIGKHNFTLMASHESQESEWQNISAARSGFLTNDVFDLNAGAQSSATNGGGSGPWAMESYLGRISYNYDNRYLLTGTYRRDGSSNFGAENRWGDFPSLSAAWRVSQEKFFNVPFISELKLRLETGLTGNQGGGTGIFSPLGSGTSDVGSGFLPNRYGNPGIQWEETRTDNVGLNVGVLKNRISLEFDYYIKNTSNLLMENPLPFYMGTLGQGAVSNPRVNIGELKTKGWSFSINTVNINKKDFRWESNLNLSHFDTEIERFYNDAAVVDRVSTWYDGWGQTWTQRAAVGMTPWLFRGYIFEGLFQSVEEINSSAVRVDGNGNRYPTDPTGVWIGDAKYRDLNGDNKITAEDETFIGNPWPKLFGGFTNNFSYKGFDLSILVTATFGNDIYNMLSMVNSKLGRFYTSRNVMSEVTNYARLEDQGGKVIILNPGTNVPRITGNQIPNDNNYNVISSKWVENGSFVRVKNISLGYNVPASVIAKQKLVRGIKAAISVQNLLTFTDYKGYDPEVGASVGGNVNAQNQAIGLDYGRYPLTPIYSLSVGINF